LPQPGFSVGANITGYLIPGAIKANYGSNPHSFYGFLRLRGNAGAHSM
jgi:hypothetical protein